MAGILASGIFNSDKMTLYIDIGTNGEMVLGNREWMLSCSCSAGPAFEGGGVKHGMRATGGAIERVRIDKVGYEPMIITVGNRKPIGICGSGLIDLLSEMFLTGLMNEKGKINTDLPTERVRSREGGASTCWYGRRTPPRAGISSSPTWISTTSCGPRRRSMPASRSCSPPWTWRSP